MQPERLHMSYDQYLAALAQSHGCKEGIGLSGNYRLIVSERGARCILRHETPVLAISADKTSIVFDFTSSPRAAKSIPYFNSIAAILELGVRFHRLPFPRKKGEKAMAATRPNQVCPTTPDQALLVSLHKTTVLQLVPELRAIEKPSAEQLQTHFWRNCRGGWAGQAYERDAAFTWRMQLDALV